MEVSEYGTSQASLIFIFSEKHLAKLSYVLDNPHAEALHHTALVQRLGC
jgi:hypothetical protein